MVGPTDKQPNRLLSSKSIYPIASGDGISGRGVQFLFQWQQSTKAILVKISSVMS